jgi:tripartite-type tricarboxylate transporter receptor subunit TctC
MRGDAGYETKQLKQIYIFESTPDILVVRQDSEFQTLEDFIAYAKENPGVITVGGSGSNSANDLGTTKLNKAADIKTMYVPFTGSGDAVPALLGGHVTALMTYSTMAIRYKDKFRPLAIASEERMGVLADVPTFKELGYDVIEGAYRGVAAPPGTPDDIVAHLAETFKKVMEDPEVIQKMDENGFKIEHIGPDSADAFVDQKIAEYTAILEELGLLNK